VIYVAPKPQKRIRVVVSSSVLHSRFHFSL